MVGEPVQQGSRQPLGSEGLGPFVERKVAGHQRGAAFVSSAEDLKQQLGPGLGVRVAVDAKAGRMTITGYDKQRVGQTAAEIRKLRVPDPYKAKGIKYANEVIKRKVGKAGGK